MAIALLITVPGVTQAQYDEMVQEVGESELGSGHISRIAGPSADGWRIVDVWESRADFDLFMTERVGDRLKRAGWAEPEIIEFAVDREDRR